MPYYKNIEPPYLVELEHCELDLFVLVLDLLGLGVLFLLPLLARTQQIDVDIDGGVVAELSDRGRGGEDAAWGGSESRENRMDVRIHKHNSWL